MTVPPPGPHGGDGHAVAAALGVDPSSVLDLSVSLNPFAPDVRALALGHLDALTGYPDPDRATRALATAIGVDAGRVVLTNGGSEAIALVGREPSQLDEPEIARAVVESVAENTVDAVVAPALWAAAAGAPGVFAYRAVNTLDAMVGHRSSRYEHFGWASARLDDIAGLVPARVTAGLVVAVRPRAAGRVARAVRDDAPAHPSPNAGIAEAAFAAALGLRLGGANRYGDRVEHRPVLGDGRNPRPDDISAAVRLSRDVTGALVALLVVPSVLRWLRRPRDRSRR